MPQAENPFIIVYISISDNVIIIELVHTMHCIVGRLTLTQAADDGGGKHLFERRLNHNNKVNKSSTVDKSLFGSLFSVLCLTIHLRS